MFHAIIFEIRTLSVCTDSCEEIFHVLFHCRGRKGSAPDVRERLWHEVVVRDGHHARHHSQLVLFCQREEVLRLLLPPRTAFWNVLRNYGAILACIRVCFLLVLPGLAMLLCPTVVQVEQIVFDYPIKLLEGPDGPSPKQALDLTCTVSEVSLRASTVALGEHAACSIPRCVYTQIQADVQYIYIYIYNNRRWIAR